jgi:hypothetical protein
LLFITSYTYLQFELKLFLSVGTFSRNHAEGLSPEVLAGETLKLQQQLNAIAALHQVRARHAAYHPDGRSSDLAGKRR